MNRHTAVDETPMPVYEIALPGWMAFENERADDLVKWIKAPNLFAAQRFIRSSGLTPLYGLERLDPTFFDHIGHRHGVDVVLDAEGEIISGVLGLTTLP